MTIRAAVAAVATTAVLGTGLALGPAAVASPASARTVQLTGAQLLSALLPASAFPAGYKPSPGGSHSSGKRLETGPAKYRLSAMSCTSFGNNFGSKGFGETATAGDGFEQPADIRGYGQQVYQFRTSGAAVSFFNGLRAVAHRCPAFVLSGAGFRATTRVFGTAPIAGGRTFQADESGTAGAKLTVDLVFTVTGTDVFFDGAIGLGVAPPASPSVRTVMLKLIKRVRAFR
jgi:hypothetical protein